MKSRYYFRFRLFLSICFWVSCCAELIGQTPQGFFFTDCPESFQLYPKNSNDSGEVVISGVFADTACKYILVRASKQAENDTAYSLVHTYTITPTLIDDSCFFLFEHTISASLVEWKYEIGSLRHDTVTFFKSIEGIVCGDCYLIMGQSNALSVCDKSFDSTYHCRFARSFGSQLSSENGLPANSWTRWAPSGALGNSPGFAGGLGLRMQNILINTFKIPIAIINCAYAGQFISNELPNSAPVGAPVSGLNIYQRMLYKVKSAGQQSNIRAVIWYQGESEVDSPGLINNYFSSFSVLHSALMNDLPSIKKLYVFQLNTTGAATRPFCWTGTSEFREVQRKLCDSFPNTVLVTPFGAERLSTDNLHYSGKGYSYLGELMARQVGYHIYNGDSVGVNVPNIQDINYDYDRKLLRMSFSEEVYWQDSLGPDKLKDYFFDQNGDRVNPDRVIVEGKTITFILPEDALPQAITYLPSGEYFSKFNSAGSNTNYIGPWIMDKSQRTAAASFHGFPVKISSEATRLFCFPNPTAGDLFILSVGEIVREVELCDLNGRMVFRDTPNNAICYMDLSSFPAGVYLIRVITDQKHKTYKLVKM